ncbi:MAG TPA: response regulator [Pyrinomonadaceae bacterium]|nr:response regulator [Pyrinomonadaceae bacterium]
MLTGRKLLLADDSLTIQKVVSLTFGDEAMEVTTVGSGAEALAYLGVSLPDIVLADVFMPEPNGYRLCERIKADERTRHIPVVLLVGTFEPFNQAEARRVGADEVLTKPFQSIRDLVNKVGGLLGGHADEKNPDANHAHDTERGEDEATRDLSPFAADARAAEPTGETAASSHATTTADVFNDFDMDDATIQATPAEAFNAAATTARDTNTHAFSEINVEEQFTDRIETDEAFVLSEDDDSPVRAYAAAAASSSSAASSESAPAAGSSFAAHAARAAEADDALLDMGDIGDIAPAREATDEADDFILDIGDDDAFDAPPAARQNATAQAAEADMFFAEQAQTTEVPKAFDQLEVFDQPDMLATTATPASPAPEEAHEHETEMQELEAPEMSVAPSLLFATETEPEAQTGQADAWQGVEISADAHDAVWDGEPAAASAVAHAGHVAFAETYVDNELSSEHETIAVQESAPAAAAQVASEAVVASEQTQGAQSQAVQSEAAQTQAAQTQAASPSSLSPEMLDEVVRRVVAHMSEQVVREIAWEVVPDLAERLIKQRLEEESARRKP